MTDSTPLGKHMQFHSFAILGVLASIADWQRFLIEICEEIKMNPVGTPGLWNYPVNGTAGGYGVTLVQPITDSFLALDSWPDHGGAYLIICSCRKYNISVVQMICNKWYLTITGHAGHILRIPSTALVKALPSSEFGPT